MKSLLALLSVSIALFTLGIFAKHLPFQNSLLLFSGVSLFFLPLLITCIKHWSAKKGMTIILCLFIVFHILEFITYLTGIPFGQHVFITTTLSFLLTPLFVSLCYTSIFLGSVSLLPALSKEFSRFLTVPLLFVGTLLIITPGAVSLGLMSFEKGGIFYQTSLLYFVGWGVVGTLLYSFWFKKIKESLPIDGVYSLLFLLSFWTGVAFIEGYAVPIFLGFVYTITIFLTLYATLPRTRNTS